MAARNKWPLFQRPGGEVIILSAMTSGIRNNWIQAIEKCMEHQQVLDQQRDDKQMTSQAGSSGGAPRRGSEAPSNLYRAASSLDPQERERSMSLSPADQDALDEVERNIRQIHRKSISDHVHQQHKPQHFSKFESGTAFTPPGRIRASPKESAAQRLFGPPRTEALRPVDESVQSGPRRSLRRNTEVISEPMMRDERRRSDLGFRSGPRAPSAKARNYIFFFFYNICGVNILCYYFRRTLLTFHIETRLRRSLGPNHRVQNLRHQLQL